MNNTTIESGFNSLFNNIIHIINRQTTTGSTTGSTTDSTIKELRINDIITNLTRVKPLGHCIARAIQLLRSEPFDNKYGVSTICKTKFIEISKKNARSGIPEPGQSLSNSPGLSSLANLFYDTINTGTPQLLIGNKKLDGTNETSFQQYVKFMKLMSFRFGDKSNPRKFEDIKNIRDKDICKGMPEDIYISSDTSKEVLKLVHELFAIQLKHAENCGKILSMMFNIVSNSIGQYKISFSNNIIENGFSEIERINHLARDILITYYSNCEYKYVEGIKLIIESKVIPSKVTQPAIRSNIISTLQTKASVPTIPQKIVQSQPIQQNTLNKPSLLQLAPATASIAPASIAPATASIAPPYSP